MTDTDETTATSTATATDETTASATAPDETTEEGTKAKKGLTPRQRKLVWIFGSIEVALLIAAQVDIQRRPAAQINGPKWRWRLISFANIVGPLAYFFFGRKPAEA